jgi:hypothetical protein
MSSGAKEVSIKSIAQAILMYVMSVFKLPDRLCEEIKQSIQKFLWVRGGGGIRWSVQGALDHSGEAANAKRSRRTRV